MAIINDVDFGKVVQDALAAARDVLLADFDKLKDIVENIGNSIVNDVVFIGQKKASGEFNEDDARVHLEDLKVLARIRLRSVAIVTLQLAERVWNAIASVFRAAIQQALGGWVII